MPKFKFKPKNATRPGGKMTISKFFKNNCDTSSSKSETANGSEPPSKRARTGEDIGSSVGVGWKAGVCQNTQDKLKAFKMGDVQESRSHSEEQSKIRYSSQPSNEDKCSASTQSSSNGSSMASSSKSKDTMSSSKPAVKVKYTPLEQQVVDIQSQNPDTVLFVECGYKYRFFGADAEVAAKELNIYAHVDHNFMTASIPVHRLFVHVRRLVAKGYKVGVVKQTETAALKAAGDNRGQPFSRQLTALYTRSTLIGEDVDSGGGGGEGSLPTDEEDHSGAHLMCITERDEGKQTSIAIMCVQPVTGDMLYDVFEDDMLRHELEMRLTHLQPAEILVPETLSQPTRKLLTQTQSLRKSRDDPLRIEPIKDSQFHCSECIQGIKDYFSVTNGSQEAKCGAILSAVLRLPREVQCCYHVLLTYLKPFKLHKVLMQTDSLQQFSCHQMYMQLPASTVRNLELFENLTDGRPSGTVFSCINHTRTRFGFRRLRSWLSKPLMDITKIEERLCAVSEILESHAQVLQDLETTLYKLPDLERGLTAILHHKCSPVDFLVLCGSLSRVYACVQSYTSCVHDVVDSTMLQEILRDLTEMLKDVGRWTDALSSAAAKDQDKSNLFVDEVAYPEIARVKRDMKRLRLGLDDHLIEVRRILQIPKLDYVKVSGDEYLIEVRNSQVKSVPGDWEKVSGTKTCGRYRSPFIIDSLQRLTRDQERLEMEANAAWVAFLLEFGDCYPRYKHCVQHLATLDGLYSLATLARQEGYCRPTFSDDGPEICIEQGRHLVVEALRQEQGQVVPNDTLLKGSVLVSPAAVDQHSGERCMVITGPNMGGKSCYIKQVAIIAILAQIGSYVPAISARLGTLDAVYTRMGASDELFKGRSTFMVELQEASDILAKATPKSLVILDELGRGTSTHDGVAIALAVLDYCVQSLRCLCLFVTHYPQVAESEATYNGHVANYHMSFFVNEEMEDRADGDPESLTFLYSLIRGAAERSYGLNVARLAGISHAIIRSAAAKSREMETLINERRSKASAFLQEYFKHNK